MFLVTLHLVDALRPHTVVPVSGMLFGNATSAAALAAAVLLRGFAQERRAQGSFCHRGVYQIKWGFLEFVYDPSRS